MGHTSPSTLQQKTEDYMFILLASQRREDQLVWKTSPLQDFACLLCDFFNISQSTVAGTNSFEKGSAPNHWTEGKTVHNPEWGTSRRWLQCLIHWASSSEDFLDVCVTLFLGTEKVSLLPTIELFVLQTWTKRRVSKYMVKADLCIPSVILVLHTFSFSKKCFVVQFTTN